MNKNMKIALWLIFFFPVGLFKMWKSDWKLPLKVSITSLFVIIGVFAPQQQQKQYTKTTKLKNSHSKLAQKKEKLPLGQYRTVEGYVACQTESWLDEMLKFTASGDKLSFNSYLADKKCIILKGNLKITLFKTPGITGGYAGIAYQGIKLWTIRDAIDF